MVSVGTLCVLSEGFQRFPEYWRFNFNFGLQPPNRRKKFGIRSVFCAAWRMKVVEITTVYYVTHFDPAITIIAGWFNHAVRISTE